LYQMAPEQVAVLDKSLAQALHTTVKVLPIFGLPGLSHMKDATDGVVKGSVHGPNGEAVGGVWNMENAEA
jgi:hypothetical protein